MRAAAWAALQRARLRARFMARRCAARTLDRPCNEQQLNEGLPIKLLIQAGVRLLIKSKYHARLW
jgi:hypothetical protein